jgi:hypothetical protein
LGADSLLNTLEQWGVTLSFFLIMDPTT